MAQAKIKLLYAIANLGWRFLIHWLRRLNPLFDAFDKRRFLKNYVPEGLPPTPKAAIGLTEAAGRCTSCGECDRVCPLLRPGAGASPFLGPMHFVISGFRAAPAFEALRADLDTMVGQTCNGCRACLAACPERIPILSLAAHAQHQREVVARARQEI